MLVAVDVGYSAVKALQGEHRALFPSVVGTPVPEGSFSLRQNQRLLAISDNGHFTPVGETALLQSNYVSARRDAEWVLSEDWLTLLQAALSELVTVPFARVQLVTGLPVAHYNRFHQQVRERLLCTFGYRRAGRDKQTVQVEEALVITQPYGALLYEALGPDGAILNNVWSGTGQVGIADIGGRTMNLLAVSSFEEITRLTSSSDFGLLAALDQTAKALTDTFRHFTPSAHEVSEWFAGGGCFRYGGQEHELWPYAQPFLEPLLDLVVTEVYRTWTEAGRFDALLLSGGGSAILGKYLKPRLRDFANVTITADPRWANVSGYYKFGKRQFSG